MKLNHPSFPWQHVVEEHLVVVFPEKQNKIVCILIINNSITSYSITYHVFLIFKINTLRILQMKGI